VCQSRAIPTIIQTSDTDLTNETWVCSRVADVVDSARLWYYLARAIAALPF
jgi:hypothetical protein